MKTFFPLSEREGRVAQVAQRGCRVFICGDIQNLTGYCPGQLAVDDSA